MELQDLKIKDVHPSASNTRKDFNGTDMAELVKSIEAVGLLNPIIVRKTVSAGFEIVAGHRRYTAVKKLGRDTIPARIMEYSNEEAQQVQIIENLHRKDLNPIEEAEAFDHLMQVYRLTPEMVAQRADKSVAYVVRALALTKLPESVMKSIREGSLTAEHGHQIMRTPEKNREALAKFATTVDSWKKRMPDVQELKREIEKKIEKDLKAAPFPKDVDKYGGTDTPACNVCPYNTGNQNVLFDGATSGKCTNPGCFSKRTNAAYKDMAAKVALKYPGMKFIGTAANPGYAPVSQIKGYTVVDAEKKKKAIKEHPEKFGFVIVKPNLYDEKKKTFVYLVSLDKAEKPEAQPEGDWEKEQFVNERVIMALRVLAHNEVPKLEKKHVLQMLDNDGNTDIDEKNIKKMSMDDLLVRLWILSLGTYEVETKLKAVGIDARETVKEITKKAEADYAAEKAKADK